LPVTQKAAGAGDDNPHLFPGAGGREPEEGGYAPGQGYLTKDKLNNVFARHLKKHCRLQMCLHVMRHICGKVILDQDPSAMGLVQVLLNHKSIETTRSYYAEVCAIVAQTRYLHLLEQGMRRALAQHRFELETQKARRRKKNVTIPGFADAGRVAV
jgi:integrase